jgi:hypothetical protein
MNGFCGTSATPRPAPDHPPVSGPVRLASRRGREPLTQAFRPHVGPHLVDVREAGGPISDEPGGSPTKRQLAVNRPNRVLLLIVYDNAVPAYVLDFIQDAHSDGLTGRSRRPQDCTETCQQCRVDDDRIARNGGARFGSRPRSTNPWKVPRSTSICAREERQAIFPGGTGGGAGLRAGLPGSDNRRGRPASPTGVAGPPDRRGVEIV